MFNCRLIPFAVAFCVVCGLSSQATAEDSPPDAVESDVEDEVETEAEDDARRGDSANDDEEETEAEDDSRHGDLADEDAGAPEGDDVESELEQMEREIREAEEEAEPSADPEEEPLDVEDELEQMERDVEAPPEEPEPAAPLDFTTEPIGRAVQSMNPDISAITDFAFAWFSDEPDLVGGHDPSNHGFNLQGVELGVQAAVDPYFRFDSFIVFSLWGVEVEEAYGTTLALPANLQLRAGQYLTNFGRINPTHLHVWNFVTQPLVIGKFFGGEGLRGLGVELSQLLPLPWFAEWYVSVQNIAGEATGRSWLGGPGDIQGPLDLTVSPRLEQYWDLVPNLGMLLGFSGAFGPNDTGRNNRSEVYGADLLLKWNPPGAGGYRELGWQNEFLLRRRQTPGAPADDTGDVLQDFGGYTELYYSPSLFWRFGGRYEYVAGVADDYLDPSWDEDRHRAAANVSYYPSHFSRLRFEYGVDFMPYRTDLDELVHMGMVQLELVIGAHGAHDF